VALAWTLKQPKSNCADHCATTNARQLHNMKIKMLVKLFTLSVMVQDAEYCGWTLARAHARPRQLSLIAAYLGKGDHFADRSNFHLVH
jgi:Uncharacterized protein conserved in bacteria (DUF2252)